MTDRSHPRFEGRHLARDTLIYGVGTSASQLLYVALLPIFTRIFSPADFGALDFLITVNGLLVTVAMLGMNSALFFFVNRAGGPADRQRIAGTVLVITAVSGAAIALVGVTLSDAITEPLLQSGTYVLALAMTFLWVPASLTTTLGLDLLRLEGRPVAFTVIASARAVLAAVIGVLAATIGGLGLAGLLAAHAGVSLLAAGTALSITRRSWSVAFATPIAGRLLRFGLPLVPAALALWVVTYSDRFLIIQLLGIDAAGVYALAARGAAVVTLAVFAFEAAWWPFAFANARQPGHQAAYARTFAGVAFALVALATFLSLFAREALLVLATGEYIEGYVLVGTLALAAAAFGLSPILAIGLQLADRTRAFALVAILCAIINVALNLMLIPIMGTAGSAIATLIASLVYVAVLFVVGRRAYPVPFPIGRVALTMLAAAVVMLGGLLIDSRATPTSWEPSGAVAKAALFVAAGGVALAILRPALRRPAAEQ
jgi:O-antigen/teichoic acid export membrane protein